MTKALIIAAATLLPLAAPAAAQPRPAANLNDRMAELCAASDVDLVGKRLARDCRKQVRAQWLREQRQLAAKAVQAAQVRVALRR